MHQFSHYSEPLKAARLSVGLLACIGGFVTTDLPAGIDDGGPQIGAGLEFADIVDRSGSTFDTGDSIPQPGMLSPPLHFERHDDQVESAVEFLSRGKDSVILLKPCEVLFNLPNPDPEESDSPGVTTLRMKFESADQLPALKGVDKLPGTINYLLGNDPSQWRTNLATFAKVRYEGIYAGIDVVFYGNERELEFDFIVAPGADPRTIAFTLEGADTVRLDERGNLRASLQGREVVFRAPFVYQEEDARRCEVAGRYKRALVRPTSDAVGRGNADGDLGTAAATFGFDLADYDVSKPLIIDPVIGFSTYLGGSGRDSAAACAVDVFGNVYVVSSTQAPMPLHHALNPFREAIHIAKFDATGTNLIFGTYFGGSGIGRGENPHGMAVDTAGNIYVVGHTGGGPDLPFPLVNPLFPLVPGPRGWDAFVAKINAAGSRILYSSVLSGTRDDFAYGVAADAAGNAYVVGHTLSADFPTTANSFQPQFGGNGDEGDPNNLQGDAFLLRISPDGSELLFSSFLGGSLADQARAVALDGAGNAFVTGFTESTDLPLENALQAQMRGAGQNDVLYKRGDAFVTKVNSAGTMVLFSTYLGGSGPDYGIDIATDHQGDVYVSGYTCCASDFPFKNGFERPDHLTRGFVTKFRNDGSQLVYSTALWGTFDYETHIAVDALGAVYAIGNSRHDIRVANPIQATRAGESDVFLTRILPDGSGFDFSTWLGGAGEEVVADVALDSAGHLFVAGATASTDFPTLNPFQPAYGEQLDGFLARLDFEVPVLQPPPATQHFTATLIGVSAEPPNASSAKGVGRFVLDGNRLTYTVDYSGLSSPPLGAHLHRADLAEVPGAVVRGHAGSSVPPGAGQLMGEVYPDATALSELANGLFHFDLHTIAFPRGEIRGRVVPSTNEPPSITFVADPVIQLNTSVHVAFTVNDSETAAGDIMVRMRSSNNRLLPNDRLVLGGAGSNRTLTATPLPGEIGVTTITLEVRDAADASATTYFKLRVGRPSENYDAGIGSLTVNSPASNAVVSGTISWSASARRTSRPEERDAMIAKGCSEEAITTGTCGVQDLTFFVDGEWVSQVGGSEATYQLDTTKLANGPHELTVRAQAWPDTSVWIGVDQRFVIVDNGRTALELRSGWNEIILGPGQTEQMAPRRVFTNGDEEEVSAGVTFISSDTNVASVSGAGIVTGIAPGVTAITTSALGLSATTRVIVDVPVGFPHFGKDGAILYQYEPGRSLFVRTLFVTDPQELEATSGLAEALKQGGINALNTGFYINPVWTQAPDLETQVEGWEDQYWDRIEAVLRAEDFSFLFTGDDVARTTLELDNTLTNPWSKDFLQLALSRARDSRRVIAIEMVDEISFVWGDTPTPSDGRWLAGNPSIPDDAFIQLMMLMNGVSNRPAITWPIGGVSPPQVAANWMGNPAFADYATHYWDTWNHPYYFGGSPLPHIKEQMGDWAMYGRLAVIQRNRPQMALVGTTGPFYQKLGEGDHFIVGQDRLHEGEHRPKAVQSEIMFAAVAGMAGVRGYSYDWRVWKEERATGAIGRSDLQTGTDPFTVGTERWDAMSQAFNFIAEIEPYLLQPRVSAVDLGEFIVTGARSGASGKVLMALNLSEVPQRINANLQPYSANTEIVRYRLSLEGWIRESLAALATDSLVMDSGETVVWIFNQPSVTWHPADCAAGIPLGSAQLNATANVPGTFAYSPPAGTVLPAGPHTLSASFTPADLTHYLPVSTSANIHVLKVGQTVSFPPLADRTTADSPFEPVTSASSGLAVEIEVLTGPATVVGNVVTLHNPGVVTLRAVQRGNDVYDPAFVEHSFNVTKGNTQPTITSPTEVTVTEGDQLHIQISATDSDTVLQIVPGGLLREVWTNLSSGGTLVDLRDPTANPRWPDQPDLVGVVATFETPVNAMEHYGVRLSGLLTPPETGDYTFYMSSDDEGVLYLSEDEQPAYKAVIASEPQWNGSREWLTGKNQASRGNPPSNISAPIHLEAGRAYFVEALMKEGEGGDNLAVAWQLPSQPTAPENGSDPIGSPFLSALMRIPEPLRFSLVEAPPGVSIDPLTGLLAWTPPESDGGQTRRVTIRVTDTGSPPLSAEAALDVTVIEGNLAPAITPIPDAYATEGTMFTLTPAAIDEDLPPNILTWSLIPLVPAGMIIDPATGVLSWSPSEAQGPGTYPITVRVTDDGTPPLWAERTFTLTVSVQPEIKLGAISRPSEGTFSFNWSSQPGVTYHVQFKNNLGDGAWTQLEPAITAIDVTATFSAPVSPDSRRFYRVVRD